jgi:hypothetical protein
MPQHVPTGAGAVELELLVQMGPSQASWCSHGGPFAAIAEYICSCSCHTGHLGGHVCVSTCLIQHIPSNLIRKYCIEYNIHIKGGYIIYKSYQFIILFTLNLFEMNKNI